LIIKLNAKYLKEVAYLHTSVLSYTFNSKIGTSYIEKLYELTIDNPYAYSILYLSEEKKVRGFLTATYDYHKYRRYIRNELDFKTKLRIFFQLIKQPVNIYDFGKDILFARHLERLTSSVYSTILTLGIDSSLQRKGIGTLLLRNLELHFNNKRLQKLFVDTKTFNINACKFYTKKGFKKTEKYFDNVIYSKKI